MKPDPSQSQVDDLLRSFKPPVQAPPGLESRILRAVQTCDNKIPGSRFRWWFLLPPACAALAAVIMVTRHIEPAHPSRPPAAQPTVAAAQDSPAAASFTSTPVNLLEAEADALARDLRRAGGFFIHCMPSVATVED